MNTTSTSIKYLSYVIIVTHKLTVKMHGKDFSDCLGSSLLSSQGKRLASTLVCIAFENSMHESTETPSC